MYIRNYFWRDANGKLTFCFILFSSAPQYFYSPFVWSFLPSINQMFWLILFPSHTNHLSICPTSQVSSLFYF